MPVVLAPPVEWAVEGFVSGHAQQWNCGNGMMLRAAGHAVNESVLRADIGSAAIGQLTLLARPIDVKRRTACGWHVAHIKQVRPLLVHVQQQTIHQHVSLANELQLNVKALAGLQWQQCSYARSSDNVCQGCFMK